MENLLRCADDSWHCTGAVIDGTPTFDVYAGDGEFMGTFTVPQKKGEKEC